MGCKVLLVDVGVDGFLAKPFEVADLIKMIQGCLNPQTELV